MSTLGKEERHLFIADCHFGDTPVRRCMRTQFKDDEEHNNVIHSNILAVASTQKILWLLGDNFTKPKEFWRLSEYAKVFQQVQLLMGNHCHTGLPRYALQFKNVNVFGVVQKFGLWLTHVPVPDYELNRGFNICGHRHDRGIFRQQSSSCNYRLVEDERYFCVSCEKVDYKPISLNEIKRIRGWG